MLNVFFILFAATFFTLLSVATLSSVFRRQIAFDERVQSYFSIETNSTSGSLKTEKKEKRELQLLQRMWKNGVNYLNKKLSSKEKKKLDYLLRDAGLGFKLSAVEFRLIQLLISSGCSLLVLFFILPLTDNKAMGWLLGLMIGFLGFRYPMFYLAKKRTIRVNQIDKNMPDFFDTVTLLIKAGVSLDAAIKTVCQKSNGPLAEEFMVTLEEMKRGKSKREAFYELRRRVPSDSLQSVLTALIQADQLGVGMAKVLTTLTVRVREQRREKAREMAMKAPIKMLFPMVFFIFPSLFIVILGPMVVKLITEGLR
ncbi:type II secretion system F family protein [Fictibacillus sp. b24]|uniref:type II secretion system F family protein n=1 Tax=Fictibacillus sp. b24 TaxID=3055863 RepID=UPI0025A20745|nr:type II secretion system F family protein [Fictibacillus sp. b24]MDM5314868.1 type II secretion system F family protein [Fictibacillus sp. b24]